MPAPRRSLLVQGLAANYVETGAGTPLVLIHGAGGSADVWAEQAPLAAFARLLALDLPGHGPGGGSGRGSVAAYADWLEDFLDALGLDRAVVLGHSMGGAVAQWLALERPERFAGLILLSTAARLRVMPRILELLRDQPPAGRSLVASLAYSPATLPGTVTHADRLLAETPPPVVFADFVACDRFDVRERLPTLAVPTLVIVGRDDRLTPPKLAAALTAAIGGAHLAEVPDAGHYPQLEQPAAVNALVRSFLADGVARPREVGA
jgi:pimeloyl-ACP methyl ester carboxylesterase